MTTIDEKTEERGFSRRTAIKAAAWSVPVIAAASAVPAYAASGTVDLSLQGMQMGDAIAATSPDGMRKYVLAIGGGVIVSNIGTTDVAAGSQFALTFDSRLLADPAPTLGSQSGTPLTPAGSTTAGNVTTAHFLLPALPAGGTPLSVYRNFGTWPNPDADNWYTDVQPYTITVTPANAADSDASNNTRASEAQYFDTSDLSVSVEWGTRSMERENSPSTPYTIDVPERVTIISLEPGGELPSIDFTIWASEVWGAQTNNEWAPAIDTIAITSAMLDGVDVTADAVDESAGSDFPAHSIWLRNTPIKAGQTLVVDLDVTLIDGPVGGVDNPGSRVTVGAEGDDDRDRSNNTADSPQYAA